MLDLTDLVSFVQLKKGGKHLWMTDSFSKDAGANGYRNQIVY